jgi:hypothetical protein
MKIEVISEKNRLYSASGGQKQSRLFDDTAFYKRICSACKHWKDITLIKFKSFVCLDCHNNGRG